MTASPNHPSAQYHSNSQSPSNNGLSPYNRPSHHRHQQSPQQYNGANGARSTIAGNLTRSHTTPY